MPILSLQLWGHWGAPNPWKVVMVLEELGLRYEIKEVEFSDVKKPGFVKINPNGRLPALRDPNTGITLWESGAIILYLIDQYDKKAEISYPHSPEKYLCQQWLAFQISGQGPYFGQATWFARFHPEKVQSATDRYVNEILRVISVLDRALGENPTAGSGFDGGNKWLVGHKCTYADLSFVTWASVGHGLLKQMGKADSFNEKHFPYYFQWIEAMDARPGVKKIQDAMAKGRAAHGLPP